MGIEELAGSPLLEFGLAGLFAVFTIILLGLVFRFLKTVNDGWRQHLDDQEVRWINNMAEDRMQRKEVMETSYNGFSRDMNKVAANLEKMGEGMTLLVAAMSEHELSANHRHEKVTAAIQHINGEK